MALIINRLTNREEILNKKAALALIGCAVVGLGLFSAITILPHANAQKNNDAKYSDIPTAIKGKWAKLVDQANQEVKQKIEGHPGWIGIISVGGGKVSIDYVGPAAANPYHYNGWKMVIPNIKQ